MIRYVNVGCGLIALAVLASCFDAKEKSSDLMRAGVPPGIRLDRVRLGSGGHSPGARRAGEEGPVFTDVANRPLYTLPIDKEAGKSACTAACLANWTPAEAPAGVTGLGDWSVLVRDDGKRQWVFRGKPLYSYVKEIEFKDDPHGSPGRNPNEHVRPTAGGGIDGAVLAEARPTWMELPLGVTVMEFFQAPGQVLAVEATGGPLYTFTGSAAEEQKLPTTFMPLYAPMMEAPRADFTIRRRSDGTRQWAFRGAPLYIFKGDIEAGDVNGKNTVQGIAPAVALQYYVPAQITLQRDQKNGGRMVEAATGQTLYVRDRVYYAKTSNFIRGPQRLDSTVGEAIGTSGCNQDCEKKWKPLLAPADAQPQGYFGIYERPDGTKQWSYRSYALYTHPSEPPGTLYGAETYDIAFDGGFSVVPPESHGTGLFFRGAFP